MRERKWTVRGMTGTLVLLCSTGGVFAQTQPAQPAANSKPAACVNGEFISLAELEAAIKQQDPMPVTMPEQMRRQQQQIVLNGLIDAALLRQFLKQQVPIDPKEVDQRMGEFVARLQDEKKSLAEFCHEFHQTPAQVRDNLAATLQWRAYAINKISEQDVLNFYQKNKDLFDKVMVHAAEIMLHVPAQGSPADREQAKARLAQLREDILSKKADFALAAKQFSQGPTRDAGGDLDWFPHIKGVLPEPVLNAAFSLQPGQMSEVINSDLGVHLIKVVDRKPGEPSDFNKIKEEVRQLCIEEMMQDVLQSERQKAKIEVYLPR